MGGLKSQVLLYIQNEEIINAVLNNVHQDVLSPDLMISTDTCCNKTTKQYLNYCIQRLNDCRNNTFIHIVQNFILC